MPTAPSTTHQKRSRRWLQFSLRTLLVVMLGATCLAAWLGSVYREGQSQWAAIAWVEQMGGSIEYHAKATQDDWRRRWFGAWFPAAVKSIDFTPHEMTSQEIIDAIYPENRDVIEIELLADLASLQSLDLSRTSVSDLSPLAGLKNLEWLDLTFTPVSDLSPLAGVEHLKKLNLLGTSASELKPLAGLENLQELCVIHTPVSDLAPLAELGNLESLWLDYSQVADLQPLAGLSSLELLYAIETQVSDLKPLFQLNNLDRVWLHGTQASPEQVRVLRETLPNCKVMY